MTVMAEAPVRYMTPVDLAEVLQIPVTTLANWRSAKKGPRFFRLGGLVRYDPADVAEWLEDQRAE